jgi:hypothetical protein
LLNKKLPLAQSWNHPIHKVFGANPVKAKKRKNFENIIEAFYELGSHTSLLSENSIVDDKIPLSTTTAAHSKEIFLNETAQQGTP